MTLQELLQHIHSIPLPEELQNELNSLKSEITNAIADGSDFNINYYQNHTGRELFRKLNNFGLSHLIYDEHDSGFRPLSSNI